MHAGVHVVHYDVVNLYPNFILCCCISPYKEFIAVFLLPAAIIQQKPHWDYFMVLANTRLSGDLA